MSQSSEKYFSSLNYTLANEDTSLEYKVLKRFPAARIVSVCGSGGRALPLLSPGVEQLDCVDLVREQLWLAQLRTEAIRSLAFEDYLAFLGFAPHHLIPSRQRQKLFEGLKLEEDCRRFFRDYFEKKEWQSLLYDGKWEKTFQKISQLVRAIVGKDIVKIFDFDNMPDQRHWIETRFPEAKWSLVLKIVGNASFFNALLYRGSFVKKNIPESFYDFYSQAYRSLFLQAPARNNFFLQLSFLGRVKYAEGNPIEAQRYCFDQMKAALQGASVVTFAQRNLIDHLESLGPDSVNFVSLSDVPSYFEGDLEKNYLTRLGRAVAPGGLVLLRSYLHVPENTDASLFTDVTHDFLEEIAEEKTQMYRVQIYRKRSPS